MSEVYSVIQIEATRPLVIVPEYPSICYKDYWNSLEWVNVWLHLDDVVNHYRSAGQKIYVLDDPKDPRIPHFEFEYKSDVWKTNDSVLSEPPDFEHTRLLVIDYSDLLYLMCIDEHAVSNRKR